MARTTFLAAALIVPFFALLTSAAFDMSRSDNVAMWVLSGYWGQKSKNNLSLAEICKNPNVNIVLIGFVNNYFANNNSMKFNLADNCDAQHFACQALEPDIESCQQQGKIMLISLGGGDQSDPWTFANKDQAEGFAKLLYNSFLGGNDPNVPRPFGKAVLDGIDIDLENGNSDHFDEMIAAVQAAAKGNSDSKKYWVTGAPQCQRKEPHIETALSTVAFDALFIQFYNNDCGLEANGDMSQYNFGAWYTLMQTSGVNKGVKLYIGAPASASSGSHYVDSPVLQKFIDATWANYSSAFGGVMLWDAYGAKANNNYDQQVKHILTGLKPAGTAAAGAAADQPTATSSSAMDTTESNTAEATSDVTVEAPDATSIPNSETSSPDMADLYRRHRAQHGHPHEGLARV
ncbi:glycoside hydrolase [Lentinus tigrinus ALCF2SS1-6]|uniref:chitinase n=1 Tax=Lentinus tigrinus ALCF2SS1-6 TaxID=1328759 RepID=A0A5C2S751_9APHY|nr:glycoside hydrolase [Lentinus tigrinus ALCF2SS1-6]